MEKAQLLISAMFLVLLLVACTPTTAPGSPAPAPTIAPTPVAGAPVPVASVKPAWQEEWDKTLAAAKAEGRLSMSGTLAPTARAALAESFKAAYDGISIEAVSATGAQFAAKILAERRAGLYLPGHLGRGAHGAYHDFEAQRCPRSSTAGVDLA